MREFEMREHLHQLAGTLMPLLADLAGMGEIAQVTEHTGIGEGALFARLIGIVGGVRTNKGEKSVENRVGQLDPGRVATGLVQVLLVILVIAAVVLSIQGALYILGCCLGGLDFMAVRGRLLASAKDLGELHDH